MMAGIILFILLTLAITITTVQSAVNLMIHSHKKPISIICPRSAQGLRLDKKVSATPSSQVDLMFNCNLYYDDLQKVDDPVQYHVSMIPLFNSSIVGCPQLDGCLSLFLRHIPPHDFVEVRVKSNVTCLYETLQFQYELRKLNNILDHGFVAVNIGQKPPTPGYLNFVSTEKLYIEGSINPTCPTDLNSVVYYMQYEFSSPNCTKSGESKCNIKVSNHKHYVSCQVNDTCEEESHCEIKYSAFVYGENKFRMNSMKSPRFSHLLALANSKPLLPKATNTTLESLTISFQKPVDCVSSLAQFHYKISYSKGRDQLDKEVSIIDKSCQTDLQCSIHLVGLLPNTKYNICVSYQAFFDYTSSYSIPSCVNSSTGQIPSQPPEIVNVTPITDNDQTWSVDIWWNFVENSSRENELLQHNVIKLKRKSDQMSVFTQRVENHESQIVIKNLLYTEQYTLKLYSCNIYGCIPGISYFLAVTYIPKKVKDETSSTQKITEKILICVSSIFFLAVSAVLYCILKKRKTFQRFRRNLRAEDIQLVTEYQNTDTQAEACATSQLLISQRKIPIQHYIPENSTLV